jgi:acyl-CoA synthetase (NDP forming)
MEVKNPDLEYLFHPRSIAVVGASRDPQALANMAFLRPLLNGGFKGKVYPVNPRASEISGLKVYASLQEIAEPVDEVICSIPALITPQLIKECVIKGVKAVHIFTAGLSESGTEEGEKLEREIVEIARQGGVRVIGPNCMGIYSPATGLSYDLAFSRQSGAAGALCQSGGHAFEIILRGNTRGVYFSKVISYGNAADLNETDFLKYFAQDEETKIIVAYIEGVKGSGFAKVLAEAARAKPVIIFKGGRTEAGAKAAASHTASIAGSDLIWTSLCHQLGVIQVCSLNEMIDLLVAFLHLKPPKGFRAGILGVGGGAAVQATDECESHGLTVPNFSTGLKEKLTKSTPKVGTSLNNPVDSAPGAFWDPEALFDSIRVINYSKEVDFLLLYLELATGVFRTSKEISQGILEVIIKANQTFDIPMAVVLLPVENDSGLKLFNSLKTAGVEAGLPIYHSLSSAARAISKFIQASKKIDSND